MKVRAIGCHGGISPGQRTTCYYIDDRFFIDAGAAASGLSIEEQFNVRDVFITHPHLDHIKDLAFVIENSFSEDRQPLRLWSKKSILKDIENHLFNNVVWPDFTKIPNNLQTGSVILHYQDFDDEILLDDKYKIKMFDVNHPGNAVGYCIDDGVSQVIFSGDTGPTEEIWKYANQCENLKAIFTEISFPNSMDALSKAAGHFTLEQLSQEISTKLQNKDIPVYISHFKPLYFQDLMQEFHEKAPKNFHLLHQEEKVEF